MTTIPNCRSTELMMPADPFLALLDEHIADHQALAGSQAAAEAQRCSSIRRSLAELHDKQCVAFETVATEVLFGGAAGGGKSHLMRVAAIVWCASIAGLQVYLFRRVRDDLIKNHVEGPKGFRALLAPWAHANWCRLSGNEIRFWNGSRIYLCHCQDERDIYKYQGAEMHVLLIDELTHFTETMYRFLRNRVRMVGIKDKLTGDQVGKFPRVLCGANPGNIGHLWVKRTFVDGVEPLAIRHAAGDGWDVAAIHPGAARRQSVDGER